MESQDILNYTVSIGFIIIVALVGYVSYHLVKTLRVLRFVLRDTASITSDVRQLKDKVKIGALTQIVTLLGLFFRKR